MPITRDATKKWARPASAAEWTALLAGTSIANPDSWWPGTEASGDLNDVVGATTLPARNTPLYAQPATGWAGTGVAATDNSTDGFCVASGGGHDPSATSQVWIFVASIETEPTAARILGGAHTIADGVLVGFSPSAGTNRLSVFCDNVGANGSIDHPTGSYVFALRYDRAASVVKAYSDLETVAGTYSATTADGLKGFGPTNATVGGVVIMGIALWSGANAETLDDAAIATIRARIESPPAGGHYYRRLLEMAS